MSILVRSIKKLSIRKEAAGASGAEASPGGKEKALGKIEEAPPVAGEAKKGPVVAKKTKERGEKKKEKTKERSDKEKEGKDSKGEARNKSPKSPTEGSKVKKPRTRRTGDTENAVGRENDEYEYEGLMGQDDDFVVCEDGDEVDEWCYVFDPVLEGEESPRVNFSCLTPEEIIQTQKRQIQEIADLLVISPSNASNLLRHYQWKTELLHQRYWDNPEAVLKEAGLVCTTPDADEVLTLESPGECLVCCEEVAGPECCALKCHHRFCNDCWNSYLTVKIKEGEVARINCPAVNCKFSVPDTVVRDLVDKDIYEKYLRFVTRSFVEDNAQITWCPAPRCGNAITTDMLKGTVVQCRCGFRFCFSCHNEAHSPANCEQVKNWQKKCSDDSETGHWLGANTKDCPRCGVFVEKNGGCNHMTCRQCKHEWCWMCIKPWKGHTDYYACARYEKAQKKKAEKLKKNKKQSKMEQLEAQREEKRKALERYLIYYTKYLDYDAKLKNSPAETEKAQAKMKALQSEQSTLAEVKFIEAAVEMIFECQSVLKYSYVYSYYIEDNSSEKHIFVFLQEELEKTTQNLMEILESPVILTRRTETVDLTKLAQTKKDNLIYGVQHGLVENEGVGAD